MGTTIRTFIFILEFTGWANTFMGCWGDCEGWGALGAGLLGGALEAVRDY